MNEINAGGRRALRHLPVRFAQSGLSLIELMVASAVGLLIMLAILTLYLNVSRTNDEMAKTNALIENGRLAIQLLRNDVAHAGFWDTHIPDFDDLTVTAAPQEVPSSIPNPCTGYSSSWDSGYVKRRLGIAVQVYDSVSDMPSGCSSLLTDYKSDTDILVVRHAQTCVAGDSGCDAEISGKLYFQASRCPTDSGQYLLATSGLTLHQRNCTSIAPKRKYVSNIYYIRSYSVTSGDGIPTLMRSEFDLSGGTVKPMTPVPLIEGIEDFVVDLGVDSKSETDVNVISNSDLTKLWTAQIKWADTNKTSPVNRGDGVPDSFVHCSGSDCEIKQLANTVALKLSLLVRSQVTTPGYVDNKAYKLGSQAIPAANDGFKRHVFSTVVRLNNISGRRDTP